MILKIYQIIKANRSLECLINQQIVYNINVAYKIYKLKKELDEIEFYAFDRLNMLFPNIDINNLTDEQNIIYTSILESDIELNINYLTKEEILSEDNIMISVDDITNILSLFEKNTK